MQGMIRKPLVVFLFVFLAVCGMAESDSSIKEEIPSWNLRSLVAQSEVVVVARLVPIYIEGRVFGDCYLIIADEVLCGNVKQSCVLETPRGYISKSMKGVGDSDNKEAWTSYFAGTSYLIFLEKKRHSFLPGEFKGLYAYGLVHGLDGIVALTPICTETRSRQKIGRQYDIDMNKYAMEVAFGGETNEHAHDFLNAIKFYLTETSDSKSELAKKQIVMSESSKAIYDALTSQKPFDEKGSL